MLDFEYVFNKSADRYADVGYIQHWCAIAFVATCTLFGMVITAAVGLALHRDPVLYKSFALLCEFQSAVDLSVLTYLFVAVLPIYAVREPGPEWLGFLIATFGAGQFVVEVAIILVIAVNRYMAITQPQRYAKIFTLPNCRKMVAACFVYGHLNLFYAGRCPMYYDIDHYMLAFDFRPESNGCGYYHMLIIYVLGGPPLMAAIVCSVLSIRAVQKRRKAKANNGTGGDKSVSKRQKQTLKQSASNCFVQIFGMIMFGIMSPLLVYFDYRLPVFFANTLMWTVAQSFNSFVLLVFNQSIRNFVLCRTSKK